MTPRETDRVRRHTHARTNQRIDDSISETIHRQAGSSAEEITRRLQKLDREWDIERTLETNASTLALAGVILAAFRGPRWLLLSGGVLGFLLLHGVQGWCPPLPLLRRLGVRTAAEIDRERFALKYLRGDFDDVESRRGTRTSDLVRAVNR